MLHVTDDTSGIGRYKIYIFQPKIAMASNLVAMASMFQPKIHDSCNAPCHAKDASQRHDNTSVP